MNEQMSERYRCALQEFYAGKKNFSDQYTAQDYGPMENIYETLIMLKLPFTKYLLCASMMMLSYIYYLFS